MKLKLKITSLIICVLLLSGNIAHASEITGTISAGNSGSSDSSEMAGGTIAGTVITPVSNGCGTTCNINTGNGGGGGGSSNAISSTVDTGRVLGAYTNIDSVTQAKIDSIKAQLRTLYALLIQLLMQQLAAQR